MPGTVALVNGEAGDAARLQGLGRLQDHVAPGFRFLNDVEDVVAGDGVDALLPDGGEDHPVVVGFAVDGVEDQISHAFFGEVPRGLVEPAAAEIEVDRAGLEVDFPEFRRDLPQGGVAAPELLPDGIGSFFEFSFSLQGSIPSTPSIPSPIRPISRIFSVFAACIFAESVYIISQTVTCRGWRSYAGGEVVTVLAFLRNSRLLFYRKASILSSVDGVGLPLGVSPRLNFPASGLGGGPSAIGRDLVEFATLLIRLGGEIYECLNHFFTFFQAC